MSKVITIGREFGSGGREIGRRLAEALQIAYYDQEIVTELVNRTALAEEYIRNMEEKKPLPLMPITIGRTFWLPKNSFQDNYISVIKRETEIIREVAEKSDCVIVGRCADFVLRDKELFRLFVYADMPFKMKRCRTKGESPEQIDDKKLRQYIQSVDKRRAQYYQFFTDQIWGDKANYDLCVNSTYMDMKQIVSMLTKIVML